MSLPFFTFSQKQEVAARYREGDSMPVLAEAFGCTVNVIHRALIQLRVPRRKTGCARSELNPCRECVGSCSVNAVKPLCPDCAKLYCQNCDEKLPEGWRSRLCTDCKFRSRYKRKEPRLCRICGRVGARKSKRTLCNVHIHWFCTGCETPLPPTRVNDHCTACAAAMKARMYAKPSRVCSQCGEREVKVHASRCQHCIHEEYEVKRWALLHLDRPCVHCGETLPKGRRLPRCVGCQRKHDRKRRKERIAMGAHRCAMCHDVLALCHQTYCPGCHAMLANWRRAWHAGCPVARSLGTVRSNRRWQEAA